MAGPDRNALEAPRPSGSLPHVVIVGGGFGGLQAALALRTAAVRLTLIDRRNYHLFQPLLYQVAMAGLSPADIAYPIRSALRPQDNAQVLLGEVSHIDLEARRVHLQDGADLGYDYLVLAAGARTNYFGHEDTWKQHSLGLKDIDEALEIRRRTLLAFEAAEREQDAEARRRLMTFAIIGGGPTGVEIAGTLAELARFVLADDFRQIEPDQARVVVVEMQDRLLPGGFDAGLAKKAQRQLEDLGVEVRLGSAVQNIDDAGVHLEDEIIDAGTVVWTAGVRARDISETLGIELAKGGRVPVESDCSIPGHPEAFAIGDIAHFVPEGSEQPLPGLAPVAMQQGRFVAQVITKSMGGKQRGSFRYRDKGIMATVGRSRAIAQSGRFKLAGFIAWLAWIFIHIWFLIGFRNRLAVLFNWFWNYITYRTGARLITGESYWQELPKVARKVEDDQPSASSARSSGGDDGGDSTSTNSEAEEQAKPAADAPVS